MNGTYNLWLVGLSFAVAILASYVALDLTTRISVASAGFPSRRDWLVGGAVSMGIGIWSMHFIGMLAFRMAMPMSYDIMLTVLSLLIAVSASGFALHIATGATLGTARLLGAGLAMGSGIAAMHYVGMAAMLIHPSPRYDPWLFVLSILIAIAASVTALWIAFQMRGEPARPPYRRKAASALVMGVAIGGMHYTGMAAAVYAPGSMPTGGITAIDNVPLAISIGAFTTILLASTLVIAVLDRRFAGNIATHVQIERALRASQEEARAVVETAYDAFVEIDAEGRVLGWNRQAESTFGWSRGEAIGRYLVELVVPPRDRQADPEGLEAFLSARSPAITKRRVEMNALHRDGSEFPVELAIWKVHVGDTYKFNSFLHDISDRRRASQRQLAQSVAAAALVSSRSLDDAAPKVLRAICVAQEWSVGVLWTVDKSTEVLRCVEVSYPGVATTPLFETAARARTFGKGHGLPGRIWDSGKPELIADIRSDPSYLRAAAALDDGLRGVVGFPIFSGTQLLAVAEFLSPRRQDPDPNLLEMMGNLTNLLGQFIARTGAEIALEHERDFLGTLLDNLSEGIVACDADGKLTLFNRATRELHGLFDTTVSSAEWATHYSLFQADGTTVMTPDEVPLMRALKGERIRNQELVIAPVGQKPRTVVCSGQPLVSGTGQKLGAVIAMHDMTERKEAERRLEQLAHFDPLTGLPNRRWFYKSLHAAMSESREKGWVVAVLFLDLDRFKTVNDTLGHEVGDELLRQVGERLGKVLRVRDVVARLGGDEFGIILMAPGEPQAAAVAAQKVTREFSAPFKLGNREVSMTASIGITIFPNDARDINTLIRYADTAMYEAKAAGPGGYRFYTAEMNARMQERLELESALSRAIEHDEFELFYQPKIDIISGQWVGVEGLLRWNRPGHGLVAPEQFIGVLEDTGLIVPVGAWVINAACRQIHEWQLEGIPLGIAANVSAKQVMWAVADHYPGPAQDLVGPDPIDPLTHAISACILAHEVPPGLLAVELTESTLILHADKTVGLLEKLNNLGLDISIDDFGTGYSSLAYLRRFPIDTLKIDRQFINDVTSNSDDAAIAVAIIVMAHSLKMKVVAEGVETKEQLQFLRENGCDQAQGYLISRPLKAAAIGRLWRKHQSRRKRSPGVRSA